MIIVISEAAQQQQQQLFDYSAFSFGLSEDFGKFIFLFLIYFFKCICGFLLSFFVFYFEIFSLTNNFCYFKCLHAICEDGISLERRVYCECADNEAYRSIKQLAKYHRILWYHCIFGYWNNFF